MAKSMTGNSIMVLYPYKTYELPSKGDRGKLCYGWAFDDERTGLVGEAFVAGADILLSRIAQIQFEDYPNQVAITFGAVAFPGHTHVLKYVQGAVDGGTDYICEEMKQPLWLCPALGKYFSSSPHSIYLNMDRYKPN